MKTKAKKRKPGAARINDGGRNTSADPEITNPEQELLKTQLTLRVLALLRDSGMKQIEIAKVLGVQQPRVSLLMRSRAGTFSVGILIGFLTALGQDVEIVIRPTLNERGALSVISA
jgi:predicted XRE-type DNA-binding protein